MICLFIFGNIKTMTIFTFGNIKKCQIFAVSNINYYLYTKILIKRGQRKFAFNLPSVKDLSKIHKLWTR